MKPKYRNKRQFLGNTIVTGRVFVVRALLNLLIRTDEVSVRTLNALGIKGIELTIDPWDIGPLQWIDAPRIEDGYNR